MPSFRGDLLALAFAARQSKQARMQKLTGDPVEKTT